MKTKIKKIIKYLSFLLLGSLISLGFLTYNAIKKSCGRSPKPHYNILRLRHFNYLSEKYGAKEILLKTKDNLIISNLLVQRPNSKAVMLIAHGFWQAKEFMFRLVDLFDEFTIFLVDLRCHGASEGDRISFGHHEYNDILAGLEFLKCNESTKNLPVIGLGISMGTSALLKTASIEKDKFKALILDSGFAKLDTHMCQYFSKITGLPCFLMSFSKKFFNYIIWADVNEIKPEEYIKQVHTPVFIIHSGADAVIPVGDAYKLYNAAKGKKELLIVKDIRHGRIHKDLPNLYKERVLKFFESVGVY